MASAVDLNTFSESVVAANVGDDSRWSAETLMPRDFAALVRRSTSSFVPGSGFSFFEVVTRSPPGVLRRHWRALRRTRVSEERTFDPGHCPMQRTHDWVRDCAASRPGAARVYEP